MSSTAASCISLYFFYTYEQMTTSTRSWEKGMTVSKGVSHISVKMIRRDGLQFKPPRDHSCDEILLSLAA